MRSELNLIMSVNSGAGPSTVGTADARVTMPSSAKASMPKARTRILTVEVMVNMTAVDVYSEDAMLSMKEEIPAGGHRGIDEMRKSARPPLITLTHFTTSLSLCDLGGTTTKVRDEWCRSFSVGPWASSLFVGIRRLRGHFLSLASQITS